MSGCLTKSLHLNEVLHRDIVMALLKQQQNKVTEIVRVSSCRL